MSTTSVAKTDDSFVEFLEDGLETATSSEKEKKEKRFKSTEEDTAELKALVEASAAGAGVVGDYDLYAERLAKTLSMLTATQQAGVFK